MITEYIELIEVMVQSEGKIGKKTVWPKFPDAMKVTDVSYRRIINDGADIIKVERSQESIGINNNS